MKEAMKIVHQETYRTIEQSAIQQFLTSKKVYALTSSPAYHSVYQIGRPFSSYFSFLHLLVRGKWFESRCYMDLSYLLEDLLSVYSINRTVRGFIATHDGIYNRHV